MEAGQPLAFARKQTVSPKVLDQILANLAVNARDAIGGMGTFDQAYCATHAGLVAGEFMLLAVSDDGCGMDSRRCRICSSRFSSPRGWGKARGWGWPRAHPRRRCAGARSRRG